AAWQDDLAIAQARTGSLDQSIESMLKFGKMLPNRSETHINLGLFYFFKNDFESSLTHLEKARTMRQDAPAVREQYLRWLVEYRLEKPTRRAPIAPVDVKSPSPYRPRSFAIFISSKLHKQNLDLTDAQEAATGLVEIMRASTHESMFLLEALGDV